MILAGFIGLAVLGFWFSFPNYFFVKGAPFLALGCVFPLCWALDGRAWYWRFVLGLVWGSISYGLLVSWLYPVSVAGWVLFTVVLSVQAVVFALFFPSNAICIYWRLLLIPSVWVFSEWVRAFFLGGFTWSLGYSLGGFPEMIQPASWGGVYAIAWVIVCINAALYLSVRAAFSNTSSRRLLMVSALAVALILVMGAWRVAMQNVSEQVRVATIQPNISPEDKIKDELYDANALRHMALTKKVVVAGNMKSPDIVVWPETSFTDDILTDLRWRARLEAAARNLNVYMLIGSALLWDGHDLNSAVLLDPSGAWQGVYHKMQLVPFIEKTPWGLGWLAERLRVGKYNFTPGTRPGLLLVGGNRLGVVICSEEFYPDMFRHLRQGGAGFAVVMLNDGWFKRKEALWLHALAAPMRAVESGMPVVRAANTGKTCAFDMVGRVLGRTPDLNRPSVTVYKVPVARGVTFYAKWGDVFALLCSVFVIISSLIIHFVYVKKRLPHAA